jgi:hypothetical protein
MIFHSSKEMWLSGFIAAGILAKPSQHPYSISTITLTTRRFLMLTLRRFFSAVVISDCSFRTKTHWLEMILYMELVLTCRKSSMPEHMTFYYMPLLIRGHQRQEISLLLGLDST